ncbi:MAG: YciI family protein [Panacagrimonas sp.]
MSYVMLIVERRDSRNTRPTNEGKAVYERMSRYAADLKRRGILTACDSLKSDAQGVRLEIRDGKRSLIDGPFAESKEMIGGFFVLDCETREEAIAIAGACPAAEWATVEVREVGPCYND